MGMKLLSMSGAKGLWSAAEEGRSPQTLRNIAWILTYLAQHLPMHQAEITPAEIETAAETWAMTTHRSAKCLHIGKREFVFHAMNWMRLLDRLREPRTERPFAAGLDAFLHFAIAERGWSTGEFNTTLRLDVCPKHATKVTEIIGIQRSLLHGRCILFTLNLLSCTSR